jgi:glutamate dehydrogenase
MRNRLDEAKSDLLGKAATVAERDQRESNRPAGDPFLRRYYRHVAAEDLVDRDPVDIFGAAASHWRTAAQRPQGVAVVQVFTPTVDEHGWSCGHTVVEIVTDDMPFLVDSVTMALNRNDNPTHIVIHPQFVVRRNVTGTLVEVCDLDEHDPRLSDMPDALVESWMHIEIDRCDDPEEQRRIEELLQRALRDVADAVEDWPRMRQRCTDIADSLDSSSLPVPEEEIDEARELLQWLSDDHFTFLGYREYVLEQVDGDDILRAVTGSGLGILRADQNVSGAFAKLPPQVRAKAREKRLLVLTKANSKATVHRDAYLDYIGVKVFDDAGEVVGERRFLGLLTSAAYIESVQRIPVLRRRVNEVMQRSGFAPASHSGKDLLQVLETFPRDELFQTSVDQLLPIALAVVNLQERRQLRLFVRRDEYGRYLSFLVYLPRDRYNTDVRERIQRLLLSATGGDSIDFTARLGESMLARLHFVVRKPADQPLPELDSAMLEKQLSAATRAWTDDFSDALAEQMGEESAARLLRKYKDGFPEGYKEDFPARTAATDVRRIEDLPEMDGLGLNLYRPVEAPDTDRRLKIYRTGSRISLTQVLPLLSRMRVEVLDERPYEIIRREAEASAYIYDFGLRFEGLHTSDGDHLKELFQQAFVAVWSGQAESDGFNALVTLAHDCRRPELFRPQIVPLLQLIDRGDLPANVTGAWAGEIGQTQMLPSDILTKGVDGDGDGRVDVRRSAPDAILTTANKIRSRGWRPGEPWMMEVRLPASLPWEQTGRINRLPLSQWEAWGVTRRDGSPLGYGPEAGLALPMGHKGPAFLVFPNFDVYLEWNQSFVYTLTAANLAMRLAGEPRFDPRNADEGLTGETMKLLQRKLEALGHDVGTVDGILGAMTREAVRKEQIRLGLPADGWPTPALLANL